MAKGGEDGGRRQKNFPMRELVTESIVGSAEGLLYSHKIYNQGSSADKENLHECVVDADEVHEEVHVAHTEYQQIDFLSLAGETYA